MSSKDLTHVAQSSKNLLKDGGFLYIYSSVIEQHVAVIKGENCPFYQQTYNSPLERSLLFERFDSSWHLVDGEWRSEKGYVALDSAKANGTVGVVKFWANEKLRSDKTLFTTTPAPGARIVKNSNYKGATVDQLLHTH